MMEGCVSCLYSKTFFWMNPCKDCIHAGGYRNHYRQSDTCGYRSARTIIDEWSRKGEIDMSNYWFSGEEVVKPGEKLNFGRSNGKTFYSIISGPMKIKNVIFNEPATIVFWGDGTKTVVKCGKNDVFDPEKGLALAISKKLYGNKGNYYNVIKKWLSEDYNQEQVVINISSELKNCFKCRYKEIRATEEPCCTCLAHITEDHIKWEPINEKSKGEPNKDVEKLCTNCRFYDWPPTDANCGECIFRNKWEPKNE